MAIDKIFKSSNVDDLADNILSEVDDFMVSVKQMQQRKATENVQTVIHALKKIETNITEKFDNVTDVIEKRVLTIKDGRDGSSGSDGRNGRDGKPGRDGVNGKQGTPGTPGKDGTDGADGVSVTNANIDFDGSLVISLSSGQQINVGEVVAPDLAEKIKIVSTMSTNGAVGIKDEGSSISTGVKNINFVGASVTATASGDDVTVNVSSGTGTVTSVAVSGGTTGLTTSGGPITTSGTVTLAGTLAVANGGTSLNTLTANNVILGNGASAPTFVAPSSSGNVLTSNGTTWASTAPAAGGTVTSASVVSANGFAGTVATATTTPAITVSTSITGVLKGNGTAISAATAGTDYVTPTGTETLTNKTIAFGSNTLSDVASLSTAQTFTGTKSFAGTSSVLAEILTNAAEVATVSATAATGTINYDVTTQSVIYYTSNASANWTVNFRASSGTSLNTAMSTGQSVTAAFLVTQGSTAYYNSVVQVDGSTVTPKYQGGTAYAAGNASSIDVYMYTIVKTGNAAFTVFTSQTKFA